MSARRAAQLWPLLRTEGLKGGVIYCDGIHNDSRMNVSIALTAALHGAVVVNHVKAESLLKDASGKVIGIMAKEQLDLQSKVCTRGCTH